MTRVFSDHCGPKGDKGDTGQPGPAGVSVIGMSISGAIANAILFADASGNLAQDAGFTVDTSIHQMQATGDLVNGAEFRAFVVGGVAAAGIFASENYAQANVFAALKSAKLYATDVLVGLNFGSFDVLTSTDDGATITIPSLAGTGTRAVVVDANGKLSAP